VDGGTSYALVVCDDEPDPHGVVEVVIPIPDQESARAFAVGMGWDRFAIAPVVTPCASGSGLVHAVAVRTL
jgi:hypothetical protein